MSTWGLRGFPFRYSINTCLVWARDRQGNFDIWKMSLGDKKQQQLTSGTVGWLCYMRENWSDEQKEFYAQLSSSSLLDYSQ
jgi:hypothetical protein